MSVVYKKNVRTKADVSPAEGPCSFFMLGIWGKVAALDRLSSSYWEQLVYFDYRLFPL